MSEEKVSIDDLLGDERLPLEPATPERRGEGLRKLPPRGVLVGVGIAIFLVLWYLSSAHHDRFYLEQDGDMMEVQRGWYFPFGRSEWVPSKAYKPFRLPAGITPEATGAMTAEDLDAQLMRLFQKIAEAEVGNLKGGNADIAEDMIRRANKLLNSDEVEEEKLMRLAGDVYFHRGISTLKEVNESFDKALSQFQNAAMRGGRLYSGAPDWVEAIKRFQLEFSRLARAGNLRLDGVKAGPEEAVKAVPPSAPVSE